ncbi:hypothetical protein D3C76_1680410 [compost metagenome]
MHFLCDQRIERIHANTFDVHPVARLFHAMQIDKLIPDDQLIVRVQRPTDFELTGLNQAVKDFRRDIQIDV